MSRDQRIPRSKLGSVVEWDGEFFTDDWKSVFVPFSRKEANSFLLQVEAEETRLGRKLTYAELRGIL